MGWSHKLIILALNLTQIPAGVKASLHLRNASLAYYRTIAYISIHPFIHISKYTLMFVQILADEKDENRVDSRL